MLNDALAATLSKVMNAEKVGKKEVVIKPSSKLIKNVLTIFNEHKYLGLFEEFEEGQNIALRINLLGNINQCGVIKPRFSTKQNNFEKWEKRYLPAKGYGILVVSTSQGLMTHDLAKEKKIGGKLIAYCY
ncbi:MAG TPA: 30S ribosomal protein S8 [Candidatus Nanoarchaeia archaeon]|nr:30S ribosomal protein S8 [Candidatus Nanoarchaeia archaeon]